KSPIYLSPLNTVGAIPGVTGVINGHKVRVVLDTGCSALLISAKCANRCGLKAKWQEDHPIFIGANGKYLKYRGTVKCNLKLEGYELELRMLVFDKLAADILHGSSFLQKHKAIIDFINERLSFAREVDNLHRIEIGFSSQPKYRITSAECITLLPQTCHFVRVILPTALQQSEIEFCAAIDSIALPEYVMAIHWKN
ncbi:hypothetical protein B4U79_17035, partial [Dinothrombium tinctorium]